MTNLENVSINDNTHVVVDGGHLLHTVIWQRNSSVQSIVDAYVTYTLNHFGKNVSVVFDGYPEQESADQSTKSAERFRRYLASSSEITFDSSTIIKVSQEKMLSNDRNKERLIQYICTALSQKGIETRIAKEDADRDIILMALEKTIVVIVVGEDVDLLVLLCGLGTDVKNLRFQKRGRNRNENLARPGAFNIPLTRSTEEKLKCPIKWNCLSTLSRDVIPRLLFFGKENRNCGVNFRKGRTL